MAGMETTAEPDPRTDAGLKEPLVRLIFLLTKEMPANSFISTSKMTVEGWCKILDTGATPAPKTYPELTFGALFTSSKTFEMMMMMMNLGIFLGPQYLKSSNTKTFMEL